jgi:fructose-specific phosphotransferase system IIC component
VLLVPAISSRPAAVAALVGGLVALFADEAGAGHLGVLFGALAGIAAGAGAEAISDRRGPRDETPLPPDPGFVP